MKIDKIKKYRTVTLRLRNTTMEQIDELARKESLSRQAVVDAILQTALKMKNFRVEIEE